GTRAPSGPRWRSTSPRHPCSCDLPPWLASGRHAVNVAHPVPEGVGGPATRALGEPGQGRDAEAVVPPAVRPPVLAAGGGDARLALLVVRDADTQMDVAGEDRLPVVLP